MAPTRSFFPPLWPETWSQPRPPMTARTWRAAEPLRSARQTSGSPGATEALTAASACAPAGRGPLGHGLGLG